jgi:hypothetical protein
MTLDTFLYLWTVFFLCSPSTSGAMGKEEGIYCRAGKRKLGAREVYVFLE